MTIPTEPIGSIPRPPQLIEAVADTDGTDDRGFSPVSDDTSTTRDTAFSNSKIRARVLGTALAAETLGAG